MSERQIRPWQAEFVVHEVEVLMETAELRVLSLTLAGGETVPWHFHPDTADLFICIEGPIDVHAKAPAAVTRLAAGERLRIEKKRAHLVHNPGSGFATFLNVQGIGPYDYIPVGDQERPKFTPLSG